MTTKNSQSDNDSEGSDSTDAESGQTNQGSNPKDSLTKEAFERLLACFSSDREEAAKLYVKKLVKLTRLFEWRGSRQPELNAQETLDRVARKILAGVAITNLDGYIAAVANIIMKEEWRNEERERSVSKALPTTTSEPLLDDDESDLRLRCLDICLDQLPPESRSLIQDYFCEDGRVKIELRRELARKLGIGLNALRIRVHRLLKGLEECMARCCKQQS